MSAGKRSNELRAGMFVVVGVLVFTAAIFLLGKKSALFSRTTDLFVEFKDISGLVVGAPVRLAGLEVGTVGAISFPEDLHKKEARVRLVVQSSFMQRIRADSEAIIDSAGLLGDKIVNISLGSPTSPELSDGSTLRAGQAVSFEALSEGLGQAVQSMVSITGAVQEIVKDERTEKLQTDLARIASSLANIMTEVEKGHGLAHRIVYDRRYADEVGEILTATRAFADKANRAVGRVEAIVTQVETGGGTLHELVYGSDGARALSSLAQAAGEIDAVVREVREGQGVVHSLIYEQDSGNFLRDLNHMSATLNRVVQDVDKGRGTIGALLRDPSVYEDLKTILGNVKRNTLFKALIRFTMENEQMRRVEQAPKVEAPEGKGAATPAPGN